MKFLPALVMLMFVLSSCLGKGNDKQYAYDPDAVYHDYKIAGEEGREVVTIMLQHRLGGPDEEPVYLDDSKLSLDGTVLKADSARLGGTFYELQQPAAAFPGKHTISFTDNYGKERKVDFCYQPLTLAGELPEELPKEPFTIQLKGLSDNIPAVQLVMIDTSFQSKDVNEEVAVQNGQLFISEELLSNLTDGPITMEIHYENEIPLKGFSKEGGRLLISYSLRRQFLFTK